jgi:hypothetical protein
MRQTKTTAGAAVAPNVETITTPERGNDTMKTLNATILWLELRDIPVWATLAHHWRLTIPAIAAVANAARRVGLRRASWQLAALAWNVWDNVPDSTPAFRETLRLMPWSGGCETAWQVASGVPEETIGRNLPLYFQFDE